MLAQHNPKASTSVFVTFSGNCKKALTFYQSCFGGSLQLVPFEGVLQSYKEMPIVSGSLVSARITIHGSDLVHNEGRRVGNYISIFFACENATERKKLIEKLAAHKATPFLSHDDNEKLIELTDAFDVRWVLAVSD